ncbi:3-oxoacyl-[acyl-carrier-protein] synthase 2 [Pseudomonas sp. Boi14]|nr:3-oxoacyl-[acyl-carrier-protein] synthase 2 [Pseudomonas sp. Boi14]
MSKRIVVTGMGAITPLGCGVEQVWRRLLAGQSGIRSLPEELIGELSTTIGGQVPDSLQDPEAGFDPDQLLAPKEQRKMDRFILFALAAAEEALAQAGWKPDTAEAQERTATIIASGVGGFPAIAEAVRTTDSKGPRRLSPFTIPSFLSNMAAGHVSIRHGLKGPLGAPVTACAAGVQAIGDAARMIRAGEIDIAVCGGAEAAIHRVSLGGFAAARALSSEFNDTPERASRPFDQARDGFVMGEGAGLLVIEELEHALARGARPIAELVGYGTSADAYHMTAGPEDGDGARRAMQQALRQAGIQASQVQHLNAHATSTPWVTKASWLLSERCSAPTVGWPSAPPNPPLATCWVRPEESRRSSPSSPCAIRSPRPPSTWKTRTAPPQGWTWSGGRLANWPCNTHCPMASALAG